MRMTSVLFTIVMAGCGAAATNRTQSVESSSRGPNGQILVTAQSSCPPNLGGCAILEIVDLHTAATSEDKGFDELRARAVAKGGDAVIGAEFEHGDGSEPSHLSGMIVRYGAPVPPHEVLGTVDIPSDENDSDKGMAAMSARRAAMGGDQVIGVTFEHGDDGQQGHLRGTVIRYTH